MKHLRSFDDGIAVEFSVSKLKKKRTKKQNDRHWARMEFLSQVLDDGRTAEDIHYDLCAAFLVDNTAKPPRHRTTRDLTTEEFCLLEEKTDVYFAEMGIYIPDNVEEIVKKD